VSASPPAAAEPAPPLEAAELAALLDRLGPFERPPRLAVAVSGGPDSLALVLLAEAWARARGGCVRALHVDHGLRPGSAAEAARLVGWLAARGIPCRVLAWLGPHPSSRLQESARAARLALLEAACAEAGILHLLLAHHADDQRETVAMRRARRSGPDGLAGMAAVRETGRVRLLRPLLGVPKARLVATLLALGQPWLEDPGNLAPAFERGRLRRAGQGGGAELEAIAACGRERAAREAALARLAGRILRPDPARGTLELDADGLDRAVPELALGLLRRALAAVGGRTYPPSPAAAARLLAALVPGAPPRRSLGGCLLRRRGPRLLVAPEPARARPRPAGPAPVLAGAPFAPMLLEGTCRLCMIGEAASGSVPGAGGSAGGAVLRDR
jgi:tRNA(Ile)-lysidine synthase